MIIKLIKARQNNDNNNNDKKRKQKDLATKTQITKMWFRALAFDIQIKHDV